MARPCLLPVSSQSCTRRHKSRLPDEDHVWFLAAAALEKQDGGTDVMGEVAHGGQGENGVTVTGEDGGEREKQREEGEEHLREPPAVLGKHRTRLYP